MARIRIALELASEGDVEQARRALAEIGVDLEELEKLVEDTLATARLDLAAGKSSAVPALRTARVQVEDVIDRAVERFRTSHPERELSVEVAAPLPELEADPSLLRRVVENLLDNARKYSDATPIALRARAEAGGVLVEIEDRGIGIDAADQQRLFTPFFRSDRSRSRGTGGVGLGLALSRKIVEANGGTIRVESAPGRGTTVRFTVPMA
jgi:signal transduction histidine kinase